MRKLRQKLVLIAVALTVLMAAVPVFAAEGPEAPDRPSATADQQRLDGLDQEIGSIADRIKQAEASIKQTEAKQAETQAGLAKLNAQEAVIIPVLQRKIADYNHKHAALREAVSMDYRRQPADAVELLVDSGSITQTLTRTKYLVSLQTRMDQLAQSAEQAARDVEDQKRSLDAAKGNQELLSRQLADLSAGLTAQRAELEELLANRSNEAVYLADKIKRAKEQQDSLLAVSGGNAVWGTFSDGATVHRGDVIGFEGSTGFSTGCHTHFSVIKDGHWFNPELFWNSLRHPDGSMIQPFGMTEWAKTGAYHGNIHNGVDFVQGCGSPVRAANDGTIIRDNRTDGSGFGHYIMIRHPDGLITLYGHLI